MSHYKECKIWLKIISLPVESLLGSLGSCYALNYRQCQLAKTNWESNIRDLLNGYGFGWIWKNQSVPDSVAFVSIFSERVKDQDGLRWSSQVCNMPKLMLYCKYKEDKQEELYLSLPIPRRLRSETVRSAVYFLPSNMYDIRRCSTRKLNKNTSQTVLQCNRNYWHNLYLK